MITSLGKMRCVLCVCGGGGDGVFFFFFFFFFFQKTGFDMSCKLSLL